MSSQTPEPYSTQLPRLIDIGRHYPRAPIAEAIIEVRVTLPEGVTVETLSGFALGRADLEAPEPQVSFSGTLNITPEGPQAGAESTVLGLTYKRSDSARLVRVQLDRFSLSWLPPYSTWEEFIAEVETEWLRYRAVAHPVMVTRLGVRYINRIRVPSEAIEIRDYLRTTVDVSNYLPQIINGYFMQVSVPLEQFDATAQVTSATVPTAEGEGSELILDIDTWKDTAIQLGSDEASAKISASLAELRQAKNYVFEACITDATRGLIS